MEIKNIHRKPTFLVEVIQRVCFGCDGFEFTVLVDGEDELGEFLISLDKEKYYIKKDIITLTGYIGNDWKPFVKKEKEVELGKKGEDE